MPYKVTYLEGVVGRGCMDTKKLSTSIIGSLILPLIVLLIVLLHLYFTFT
jgi:hypothetical protein